MTDELVQLLDSVPIVHRLMELLEERGWRGGTKLERIVYPSGYPTLAIALAGPREVSRRCQRPPFGGP